MSSNREKGPDVTRPEMGGLEPIHTTSVPFFGVVWVCSILICVALWEPFTYFFVNYYSKPEPAWINNLFYQKNVVANRELGRGGRLIIFGGSGVLYGVDAEMIEKKLGIPTVNYGIQGGLGVRYTLDRAMTVLRPGDTALLVIEYGGYGDIWRTAPGSFHSYLWSYDPDYIRHMGIREKIKMFWSVRLADYPDSYEGWIEKRSRNYFHLEETSAYSVGTVGPNGDMRACPIGPVHQSDGPPFVEDPGAEDMQAFSVFCRWARMKGIKVLFSWPAYIHPKLSAGQTLDPPKYMTDVFRATGMTVLDTPEDNMYPPDLFLDSSYHLTPIGRRIRTEELIRRLRPVLGLPPASEWVRNVLLLTGREHRLTPGNLFLDDTDLEVLYLSKRELPDSRTITPEGVAQLVHDGLDVYTDSDESAALLAPAGLSERVYATGRETVESWFARHRSNILMVGVAPGSSLDLSWRLAVPPAVFQAISSGGAAGAIFGTGPYSSVLRIVTDPNAVLLKTDLPELMPIGDRIPTYMEIESTGQSAAGSFVRMNVDYLDVGKINSGCFAVAIDPELGAVVDTATFGSGPDFQTWHLNRVLFESTAH
jgi:hypothetical protein